MKTIALLILALACTSQKPEKKILLGQEEAFLKKLQSRTLLINSTFDINSVSSDEKDLTLKGLINYYPFADVKLVIEKMTKNKIKSSSQNIERELKADNDQIMDQMTKLIAAFRLIPPEQKNRSQEALDRFSLQIRRREQAYSQPLKCFNDHDCTGSMRCLTAGFCTK